LVLAVMAVLMLKLEVMVTILFLVQLHLLAVVEVVIILAAPHYPAVLVVAVLD
jgi:hypothetical protein